jgi:hypothetical protein
LDTARAARGRAERRELTSSSGLLLEWLPAWEIRDDTRIHPIDKGIQISDLWLS